MKPIEIAEQAARIGAEVLLDYWQELGTEDADLKARNDWVSRADRESEAAIQSYLADICPADAFVGEESGFSAALRGSSGRVWVVDPLDGTSNYLQHFPFWCVSVAVRQGDEVIAGVVYEPLREILYAAESGGGAYREGERMSISKGDSLDGSFVATGFPFRAHKFIPTYTSILVEVMKRAKGIRRAGSAALDLAYTAAGIFDGFFEMHLAPWDVAAGALLVREAGGLVSDFSGGERFWERGNIIGATPAIHRQLLDIVEGVTTEEQLDR